jgi:hypothetical protein
MPGARIGRLPQNKFRFRSGHLIDSHESAREGCDMPAISPDRRAIDWISGSYRRMRAMLAALALTGSCLAGVGGAQTAAPPAASVSDGDLPIYMIHRVVILNVPIPQSDNTHVQKRVAVERAKLEQRRHKPRKRLFASEPAGKPTRKRPPILPPSAAKKPREAKEADVVPPEQRLAIAQPLLIDALTDRLLDRLKIATVPDSEVRAALSELHLSPQAAGTQEGALKLCSRLAAQAVLTPRITGIYLNDGITRDCVLRVTIRMPGMAVTLGPYADSVVKSPPAPVASQVSLPSELMISGSAQVDRVLFGSQYVQSQAATIRLAAQQAAALVVHTLSTGETAPFMSPDDRLGVVPAPAPTQADRLVFTEQGRRVMPAAVHPLPADASPRFKPQLLPLLPRQILTADQIRASLSTPGHSSQFGSARAHNEVATHLLERLLWINADTPNVPQVKALAERLGVNYILMVHVTDIELEEGPPPAEAAAVDSAVDTTNLKSIIQNPKSRDREREAKAEAVGALIRASDGMILWRAHAAATMSALMPGNAEPATWPTEQHIAGDAVRFALVDLERQLAHYRDSFEH